MIVVAFLTFYLISLLYSFLQGSPYVGTKKKNTEIICQELLKIKEKYKIKRFVDLGSGDGRLVLEVSKKLNIPSLGFEINPYLYFLSILKARFTSSKAKFILGSYIKFKPRELDLIYLYHLPWLLNKIINFLKMKKTKNLFVLSHEFKVKDKAFRLIAIIDTRPYKTYLYQV